MRKYGKDIYDKFKDKSTDELNTIINNNDRNEYIAEVFTAITDILKERGELENNSKPITEYGNENNNSSENKKTYDDFFNLSENIKLLAISVRTVIKKIGIVGIVYGIINIIIGVYSITINPLNFVILILGGLMVWFGIEAIVKHSLSALKNQVIISVIGLLWDILLLFVNSKITGEYGDGDIKGIGESLIAIIYFSMSYRKLKPFEYTINLTKKKRVEILNGIYKKVIKAKRANNELKLSNGFMRFKDNRAIIIQKIKISGFNTYNSFIIPKENFYNLIKAKKGKKTILSINHPLSIMIYKFKNEKYKFIKTIFPEIKLSEKDQTNKNNLEAKKNDDITLKNNSGKKEKSQKK